MHMQHAVVYCSCHQLRESQDHTVLAHNNIFIISVPNVYLAPYSIVCAKGQDI